MDLLGYMDAVVWHRSPLVSHDRSPLMPEHLPYRARPVVEADQQDVCIKGGAAVLGRARAIGVYRRLTIGDERWIVREQG